MDVAEFITLTNKELTRFLFAVILLLVSAHLFAYIFQKLKIPRVIGEIFGGIVLGPSILGFLFPNAFQWVFGGFEAEGKLISSLYWFGLVLLMFISGFEIQRTLDKGDKKILIAIMIGSTVIPFFAGWIAPRYFDFSPYLGTKQNYLALTIVIAIAIAITSIPVISKIFIDLNIMNTRFAKIVLAAATIHDVILWIALAIATGLVSKGGIATTNIIKTVAITLGFFIIMLLVMPQLANIFTNSRLNLLVKSSTEGYALFLCLVFAALASILDVNVVFGAFLAGIVLGRISNNKFESVKANIKRFSLAFFIPIYFAVVGIKIDLIYHFDIKFFICFLLLTSLLEMGGTYLAAKIIKLDNLSSFNFAVAMTARGGPGIVLATVSYDLGIINETFFVTLVLIAIVTSLFAGLWFKFVLSKKLQLLK